jgi:hypothetical protein
MLISDCFQSLQKQKNEKDNSKLNDDDRKKRFYDDCGLW